MKLDKCHGLNCLLKDECLRFDPQDTSNDPKLIPPFKIENNLFECVLFHGKAQDSILQQLKSILTDNNACRILNKSV